MPAKVGKCGHDQRRGDPIRLRHGSATGGCDRRAGSSGRTLGRNTSRLVRVARKRFRRAAVVCALAYDLRRESLPADAACEGKPTRSVEGWPSSERWPVRRTRTLGCLDLGKKERNRLSVQLCESGKVNRIEPSLAKFAFCDIGLVSPQCFGDLGLRQSASLTSLAKPLQQVLIFGRVNPAPGRFGVLHKCSTLYPLSGYPKLG